MERSPNRELPRECRAGRTPEQRSIGDATTCRAEAPARHPSSLTGQVLLGQGNVAVALEVAGIAFAAGLRIPVAESGLTGQLFHALLGDLLEFVPIVFRQVRHEILPNVGV